MSDPVNINAHIVESLYCEALVLSDEVRETFAGSSVDDLTDRHDDLTRVALSCEGLRTTTRMMHAIAWLLNHRAHIMGELTEFQLRRHGRLSADLPGPDPANLPLLPSATRELIAATDRFYARLLRLERSWRRSGPAPRSAVDSLRERLQNRMAS